MQVEDQKTYISLIDVLLEDTKSVEKAYEKKISKLKDELHSERCSYLNKDRQYQRAIGSLRKCQRKLYQLTGEIVS